MEALFRFLATAVELSHAVVMIAWGLGMPLLIWHGLPRLSRLYLWLSISFVTVSVASHQLLGECVLTTLARHLWEAAGGHTDEVTFIVSFTNRVAGIRPSARAAVVAWEVAIALYSVAALCGWCRLGTKGASGLEGRDGCP